MNVTFDRKSLLIDGRRVFLRGGAFHYFRLPAPGLWRDRLLKIKRAGYNAVDLYFPWSYHSEAPGHYDFTGIRDVDYLLDLVEETGLYLIARPSPFINAELSGGGTPYLAPAAPRRAPALPDPRRLGPLRQPGVPAPRPRVAGADRAARRPPRQSGPLPDRERVPQRRPAARLYALSVRPGQRAGRPRAHLPQRRLQYGRLGRPGRHLLRRLVPHHGFLRGLAGPPGPVPDAGQHREHLRVLRSRLAALRGRAAGRLVRRLDRHRLRPEAAHPGPRGHEHHHLERRGPGLHAVQSLYVRGRHQLGPYRLPVRAHVLRFRRAGPRMGRHLGALHRGQADRPPDQRARALAVRGRARRRRDRRPTGPALPGAGRRRGPLLLPAQSVGSSRAPRA